MQPYMMSLLIAIAINAPNADYPRATLADFSANSNQTWQRYAFCPGEFSIDCPGAYSIEFPFKPTFSRHQPSSLPDAVSDFDVAGARMEGQTFITSGAHFKNGFDVLHNPDHDNSLQAAVDQILNDLHCNNHSETDITLTNGIGKNIKASGCEDDIVLDARVLITSKAYYINAVYSKPPIYSVNPHVSIEFLDSFKIE